MNNPFGLIIQCDFNTIEDFEITLNLVNPPSNNWIWLKGETSKITPHINTINQQIETLKINLFCEIEQLIDQGLKVKALIIDDFEQITMLKEKHPSLLVGGIANDLAKAKNIELFEGDFVFLGPIDEIGENPYVTLIPEKPDYEWRFIDITIPVVGFGSYHSLKLKEFTKTVDLSGFACRISDFQKHIESELRFVCE